MRRSSSNADGERGATLVEFAFVLPVLVLLLFGLADLCLVLIGNSVGSNAAREGARVGIIKYVGADQDGSANHQAIVAAVNARLGGLVRDGEVERVTARCFNGEPAVPTPVPCRPRTTTAPGVDLARRDLIEVEVEWQHLGATPFVASLDHTDTSRMVIVGEPDLTMPPPPPATPRIRINDVSAPEGDSGQTAFTFTLTRTPTVGEVSVRWATADGTARDNGPDADFVGASGTVTFPAGQGTRTVTVQVNGDTTDEPAETFAVNLSDPVDARIEDGLGLATIENDDASTDPTPPGVSSVVMIDENENGRVDGVRITFDEPLGPCPGTAGLSATGIPSAGTLGSVTRSGSVATVAVNEGPADPDTAVGSFRLTLQANPNGLCDQAGNASSFPATAPADRARPVVLALSDTNGSIDGQLQVGDAMAFTFSEPVGGAASPTTLSQISGNGGSADDLDIPGITAARSSLGGGGYVTGTEQLAATVTSVDGGRTLRVTATGCNTGCTGFGQDRGRFSFTPSPGIRDAAGNSAIGSVQTDNQFRAF